MKTIRTVPDSLRDGPKPWESQPGKGSAAFSIYEPNAGTAEQVLPVLIAVPHAGRDYSEPLLANMREPDLVMHRLEDRYADAIGVEALRWVGASLLVAHAPRAMIDLNRARDDVDWSMISHRKSQIPRNSLANRRARSGLGLIPRRLLGHGEIWRHPITHDELDKRIDSVHRPYHQALGRELARIRDKWGSALLIDLHSMPPLRLRQGEQRGVEFVIGDRFGASCAPGLVAKGQNFLESQGRRVTHNRPYSGGYVLNAHGLPRHGIHALQLEVCRSIYLDDSLNMPDHKLASVGKLVGQFAEIMGQEVLRMGGSGITAQAAE